MYSTTYGPLMVMLSITLIAMSVLLFLNDIMISLGNAHLISQLVLP